MDSQEMTQLTMRHLAEGIETVMSKLAGKKVGFVLLVFPFDEAGRLNYISNADRKDMKKALAELLNRWEQGNNDPLTKLN